MVLVGLSAWALGLFVGVCFGVVGDEGAAALFLRAWVWKCPFRMFNFIISQM